MSGDAVARIAQARPGLRPSEQRVADAILAEPASIVDLPITELAERCSTSVATVVRFCQAAGYAGYGELRLELASTRGREEVSLGRFGVSDGEIEADDDAHDVLAKIAYHEAHAIESTAASIDAPTLDAVAGAIAKADRVDIYGVGSSALAAIDLQQKLHRIGLVSFYNSDIHLALTSAALLTGRSVSVGFSHSGLSVETVDSLSTARRAGAATVAVTNFPASPIAEQADHVLVTSASETRYRPGAMSSRIAQLAVVDFLFVRLVQGLHGRTLPPLQLTYDAVQTHRLPPTRHRAG
ncbi:RpiR family transcriptional regulator [Leifsonia xyli subsp. cynodontis DSM 46306]|jgi:DNA-binding MurR/RpiR family transcriptional regulator|uniref:RpiR family transcriptional regulator n=1 Tax=Leifsonia xyli subsp. cynodontis DSM 46306 TaxID=1389489 RepID=U3PBQ1_LEIXC|nr:MurR/RpiR family transcriptional regulator [Leifsonia xyli]AGW40908.1 RpiR family transcriptional regulator [Leifsonia xyli subsp. cynodontis DSM 46306]